jgi:hypothetical protein
MTRRSSLMLVVALVASLVGAWGAPQADATSYRFWSYWTGGADWTFSSQGAARRPADGSVDGWRFAVSPASSSTIPPRHAPSFDSLCGKTPAQDGKKRVGLVVDPGLDGDAPGGETPPPMIATCVVVPADANGYDVLMTVATLRSDQGLICGINGYPATECGAPVADPTPTKTDGPNDPGGSSGSGSGDGQTSNATGSSSPNTADDPKAARGDSDSRKGDDKPARQAKDNPSATPTDSGAAVAAVASTSAPAGPSSGSPVGLLVGLVVVAVVGVVALVVRRKRT